LVAPGPGMRMSVDEVGGHIAVSFHGDVDLEGAARVEAVLHDAVSRCTAGVSVDLSGVTFLGSTGVRLLLAAGEHAKRRGTRLSFVLGDGPARRVMDLLGLCEALDVVDPRAGGGERDGRVDRKALGASLSALEDAVARAGTTEEPLERVVEAGRRILGVSGVCLMLLDAGGALLTAVVTDETLRELETAQAQTGEGPCIECVVMGRAVRTGDLRDDARWPRLATRLATSDVRAVLGVPTRIAGAPVGSLNVYRSEPYDWHEDDVAAVEAYNRIVEDVLVAAVAARRNERIVEQLQEALDRRVPIERSVGMLMGRHGLDAVAAFAALRRTARAEWRRVADVAEDLLAGTEVLGLRDLGGG
jgi:anti-anti-sigma factor